MRTVLAAAAAGALIIGSAAGAMADENPAPAVAPAPVVKIQKVDIHRHSPINVDKARNLKVRMTVRTPGKAPVITAASVTLAQFTKKVGGVLTPASTIAPIVLTDFKITPNADGTVYSLKGAIPAKKLTDLGTVAAGAPLGTLPQLGEGKSALLCISAADTTPAATVWSKQTMKRLGDASVKKVVRECVKIYNPKAKPAKKNS